MKKCRDYLWVWRVEFKQAFSSDVFSVVRVAAWTVEEAIKKALRVEEGYGKMNIRSVVAEQIIDA